MTASNSKSSLTRSVPKTTALFDGVSALNANISSMCHFSRIRTSPVESPRMEFTFWST